MHNLQVQCLNKGHAHKLLGRCISFHCGICVQNFKEGLSRSKCIDYWNQILAHFFAFTPIIMIETSQKDSQWFEDVPFWSWGQKVKVTTLHLSSWNLTQRLPMSQGCALFFLGVKLSKVKVKMHWLTGIEFECVIALPWHLSSWNFIKRLHLSRGCALLISGSKVKVTMHLILKKGFLPIIALPLHQSSWNFSQKLPMSQRCACLISGSKGQCHNALITVNELC